MTPLEINRSTVAAPPPAVSLTRAMLWNWWLVLLAIAICAGIGAAAALTRSPDYTAKAKLAVGRIDITSPGALSGYAVATEALATGYSRTVTSAAVANAVAAKTGISVDDIKSHVSATPVPESPVFRVEATSGDEAQAVLLANASAHALIRYVARLNQSNPDSERLYRSYRRAVIDGKAAKQQLRSAEAAYEVRPIPPEARAVDFARAEVAASTLRVEALGHAYNTSVQSQSATQLIQVLSPADEAASDRRSTFIIYTFVGFVVGLLLGGLLAYIRETRFQPETS